MIAATRAAWVLPIVSPPVRDGGVLVERGRILAVGPWAAIEERADAWSASGKAVSRRDAGDAVLMPGLVNAHTHLELSWMHGRVPPAPSLPAWVRTSMALRRDAPDPTPAIVAAIRRGPRVRDERDRRYRQRVGEHRSARRERPAIGGLPRDARLRRGGGV